MVGLADSPRLRMTDIGTQRNETHLIHHAARKPIPPFRGLDFPPRNLSSFRARPTCPRVRREPLLCARIAGSAERASVFGDLQSYLHEFAPIKDRNARLILSKNLLVSKTP